MTVSVSACVITRSAEAVARKPGARVFRLEGGLEQVARRQDA